MNTTNPRGYFGIGIENPIIEENIGTLWRSAFSFGASFIFTIGGNYEHQATDSGKAYRHIPLYKYEGVGHFLKSIPKDCNLIGVEIDDKATDIFSFTHPQRAIYILGSEGSSLTFQDKCSKIIYIPTRFCLNVAVAGSIVLYDRNLKFRTKILTTAMKSIAPL